MGPCPHDQRTTFRPSAFASLCALWTTAIALALASATAARAATVNNGCMGDVSGFALGCTSNDVRVAGVATNPDGTPKLTILDDGCRFPGDTVDFTATLDVLLTAQARYDIGIYFATDGDPNSAGALTGSCSVTTLDSANTPGLSMQRLKTPLEITRSTDWFGSGNFSITAFTKWTFFTPSNANPRHRPKAICLTLKRLSADVESDSIENGFLELKDSEVYPIRSCWSLRAYGQPGKIS